MDPRNGLEYYAQCRFRNRKTRSQRKISISRVSILRKKKIYLPMDENVTNTRYFEITAGSPE